ncbi:MAG: hypothetical protein ACYDCI_11765 [Candidatus Limnocylindrales bacterium]
MSDHPRQARVRADVIRLCQTAVDRLVFYGEANRLIAKIAPFDLSCWHQLDPATLLPTSHYNEFGIPAPAAWAHNEYWWRTSTSSRISPEPTSLQRA